MVARIAEPIPDPATGKLASGTADKEQRQGKPRGRNSRPLSDQQERQAHEKAASLTRYHE
jgi:hypothetical protein